MLLNAHTATRSFRELQFDLKSFLEAFAEILPVDGPEIDGIVEVRWADGSVDMVPTFKFISAIVLNRYPELLVGGSASIVPGTDRIYSDDGTSYRDLLTLFIKKAGLSAKIRNLGRPYDDLKFVKGVIRSIKADTVDLGWGVEMSSLSVRGVLSASVGVVDKGEFTYVDTDMAKVNDVCDLSSITYTGPISTPFVYSHNLSSLNLSPNEYAKDRAWGYCYVDGPVNCGKSDDATIEAYKRYDAKVFFEVPVPNHTLFHQMFWRYVNTSGEDIPLKNDTEFSEDSVANLMLLYPKKQVMYYETYRKFDKHYRIVVPSADDENAIISIRNVTGGTIHACNAWRFGIAAAENSASGTAGTITPLSYVDLPPYSAVDFLLQSEIVGEQLQVYLLPMCMLPEASED